MPEELRIAVFASGRGSNFKAILDAINSGKIHNARIVLVVSNNSDAGALSIAREQNIPAIHLSRKQFESDEEFDDATLRSLKEHAANFIVLAGYMKKVASLIIASFRNRIVNIHPALLPDYGGEGMYGHRVHEAVIAGKAANTGASIHIVDEKYDQGPVILQKSIPVYPNDTPQTLATRVLAIEHEIYPEVIRLFAENRVRVDGQHVTIRW